MDEDKLNKLISINGPMVSSAENLLKGVLEPEVVVVSGEFDEPMALKFRADMSKAMASPQSEIVIEIDSYGGQCYSLLSMLESVEMAKKTKRVITVATGKACSCGAFLFTAGHERWVGAMSEVMVHEVASSAWGKNNEVKATAEHLDRLNNRLLKMAALNIGQPENYFIDIIHARGHTDLWLEPEDCLKMGIATKIGTPTYRTTVTVATSVE